MEGHLLEVDWDFEFAELSLDGIVARFCTILSPLIERYVPDCRTPRDLKFKHRPPNSLVNDRRSAWSSYKDARSVYGRRSIQAVAALTTYQEINSIYRNYYTDSVSTYEQSLAADLETNSKLFHSYVRSKKVGNPSVGPLRVGSNFTSDCYEMAEMFATGLSSVYCVQDLSDPFSHQRGSVYV